MRTLQILAEEIKSCTKCELHKTRTQTVFARGNPQAPLCFLGEAPGIDEDSQGFPFVGKSGQLLDQTLISLGLDLERDIYVCNIIKCRPPNNRRPESWEIVECMPYLNEQLALVNPKVIVALGNTAVIGLLGTQAGITKIRGKIFPRGQALVIPSYHPSFIIRNGNTGQTMLAFKADLQLAINKVKELS
jgi:uracil-DNA glycosylase